jgi:hypothetical protein
MNRLLHWLLTHPVGDAPVAESSSRFDADESTVRVDRERMQGALESQTYEVPRGLSREEKRQRILAVARRRG